MLRTCTDGLPDGTGCGVGYNDESRSCVCPHLSLHGGDARGLGRYAGWTHNGASGPMRVLPGGRKVRRGALCTATLSDDRLYRYRLERRWGSAPAQVFVMLNPSTADATADDQTIRRCMDLADREGAGGIVVVNLFAWRATQPSELLTDRVTKTGPENDAAIATALREALDGGPPPVVAWGSIDKALRWRARDVRAMLPATTLCLGYAADGSPRHPSRLGNDVALEPWPRPLR